MLERNLSKPPKQRCYANCWMGYVAWRNELSKDSKVHQYFLPIISQWKIPTLVCLKMKCPSLELKHDLGHHFWSCFSYIHDFMSKTISNNENWWLFAKLKKRSQQPQQRHTAEKKNATLLSIHWPLIAVNIDLLIFFRESVGTCGPFT